MKNEIDVLLNIIEKLEATQIEYMLTGSMAMNFYAEPRMTRDIDIVVEIRPQNKELFVAALKSEYYFSEEAFEEALQYNSMFNVIHQDSVIKVDFILRKEDDYSVQAFARKSRKKINDHAVFVISKEDLIISKILWSRESESDTQRKDIINLLETDHDAGYLKNMLRNLTVLTFAREFIDERYFT